MKKDLKEYKVKRYLLKNEKILPIKGFEKLYAITTFGRVFSLPRVCNNRTIGNTFLALMNNGGYKFCTLAKNGKQFHKYVHRIVAEHFIPNPYNFPQVNHKNGIKSDNRVENLEWCNSAYNTWHRDHILNKTKLRIKCLDTDEIFISAREAARKCGLSVPSVCAVLNRKRKSSKGLTFVFINTRSHNTISS